MEQHRDEVESLVREDLRSERQKTRQWALSTAGEMKLRGLYSEVVAAFHGPEHEAAAYTLRDLDDPRAIPVLIEGSPDQPTRYFESLRHLQRDRPAHRGRPCRADHVSIVLQALHEAGGHDGDGSAEFLGAAPCLQVVGRVRADEQAGGPRTVAGPRIPDGRREVRGRGAGD